MEKFIDVDSATKIWEEALSTTWQGDSLWVHGDISPMNLLVRKSKLSAVINFGQLAIGDPACDLTIAWTLFLGESRELFRLILQRGCVVVLGRYSQISYNLQKIDVIFLGKSSVLIPHVILIALSLRSCLF